MKILTLCMLLASFGLAQPIDSLLLVGNKNYLNEDYKQASINYEKILNYNENKIVYLNLGNSYYKIGDLGQSIWAYEKGLLLSPRDEDINFNLKFLKSKIKDQVSLPESFLLLKYYNHLISAYSLIDFIGIIGIVLLILAFVFLFNFWNIFNRYIYSLLRGILLTIICVLTFLVLDKYLNFLNRNYAIIVNSIVNVYSAPVLKGDTMFRLNEGTKVEVLNSHSDWYEIVLIDGKKGWALSEFLRPL